MGPDPRLGIHGMGLIPNIGLKLAEPGIDAVIGIPDK
jgi:hypothetical protein